MFPEGKSSVKVRVQEKNQSFSVYPVFFVVVVVFNYMDGNDNFSAPYMLKL